MSSGACCETVADVGGGDAGLGDHRLDVVDELGAGEVVGDLADRGEGGVDVVDGAAGAQVGDEAAELGEGGVDRGGHVGDALALHEGVDGCRRARLAEATSWSSGSALDLGGDASIWSRSAGTPSAAVPMLATAVLVSARTPERFSTSWACVAWSTTPADRGEDRGELARGLLDAARVQERAGVGEEEAEVLGGGLISRRGDEGVDVGEEVDGALAPRPRAAGR